MAWTDPRTDTPPSPWNTTLRAHPRIFLNPSRITLGQTHWNSTAAMWTTLKSNWGGSGGLAQLIQYVTTGNTTALNNAYTAAVNEGYSLIAPKEQCEADLAALVLDWGYAGLSAAQRTNLVTKLEANIVSRMNTLTTQGELNLSGAVDFFGLGGLVFGQLAIEGEGGATSRIVQIRNMLQNLGRVLDEGGSGGHWWGYGDYSHRLFQSYAAYFSATSQENLLASKISNFGNKADAVARMLMPDGTHYLAFSSNQMAGVNSWQVEHEPWPGYACALAMGIFGSGLWRWLTDQQVAHAQNKWTQNTQAVGSWPTYLPLFMYDDGIPSQSPAVVPLPLSRFYGNGDGLVNFRGGWNYSTDVSLWFHCGPNKQNVHDTQRAGTIELWRGGDELLSTAYNYSGRPGVWENGPPIPHSEVGNFSMCCGGILLTPTSDAFPERNGSQVISTPSGSTVAYPLAPKYAPARVTWDGGHIVSFNNVGDNPNDEACAIGDATKAYTSVQLGSISPGFTAACSYVRGATSTKGLAVLRDIFTLGNVSRIRKFFFCRSKPTVLDGSGPSVVVGSTSAGVLEWTGASKFSYTKNSSKVTVQLIHPAVATRIRLIGGTGFDGYYDGANLAFVTNRGGADPSQTLWGDRVRGCWRIEFEVNSATDGEVVFAITVDDSGASVTSYSYATLQTLAPQAFALPANPGQGGGGGGGTDPVTSFVPVRKNDTNGAIFYAMLIDQADTRLGKVNPTLAAGDFQISLDGGAFANLANLPTVVAAGRWVKFQLSQAETNADNIVIDGHDVAGAQWCDVGFNIQTVQSHFDDLLTTAAYTAPDNATIGTLSTAIAGVATQVTTLSGDVAALPVTAAQTGDAMTLTAGERNSIADALLDKADGIETGHTLRQWLKYCGAVLFGKSTGADTTAPKFRNPGDTKDRVAATTAAGGRTTVTLDPS